MSRKDNWNKGYDFEEGRQAYKDKKRAREDFMEGLGVPKSSRSSQSSQSPKSSGFSGSGGGGVGVGGGLFIIVVLLLLAGAMHSLVFNNKVLSSIDVQMEYQIGKWVDRSDLVKEVAPYKNCDYEISLKAYDMRTIEYEYPLPYRKTINWGIIEIYFIVEGQKQNEITLVLWHSCTGTYCLIGSGGFGCRVSWRSDKDNIILIDRYNMESITIS